MPEQNTSTYHGQERRAITEIELAFARRLHEHEANEESRIRAIVGQVIGDLEAKAFPDGALKHGEYHLSKINAAKAEEKFWSELKLDLAKKGLWGIITILAGMVVLGFGAWVSTLGGVAK